MQLVALDDFQYPAAGVGSNLGHLRPLIARISKDALDEGKQARVRLSRTQRSAVAILDIGRMNDNVQQETKRVDQDMPLAARDLLARIEALRIDRRAPFCAALALWLSMMAAVGLASRPACSRTAT